MAEQNPTRILTPIEQAYSYQSVAAKCEEVSEHLVRLADLLHCTGPNLTPPCALSERAIVQSMIRGRRLREKFFDAHLFADPVWDILLELYLAHIEQRRVSVSSLCIAAAVPTTTALRYVNSLIERDIVLRQSNPFDGRMSYVELTERALSQMRAYCVRFSELLTAVYGK